MNKKRVARLASLIRGFTDLAKLEGFHQIEIAIIGKGPYRQTQRYDKSLATDFESVEDQAASFILPILESWSVDLDAENWRVPEIGISVEFYNTALDVPGADEPDPPWRVAVRLLTPRK